MTIEKEVIAIIAEQLGADQNEITPNTSLVEGLNADSLDLTEVIMALEEEFEIEIPDDQAEKLKTVQDVISLVAQLRGL